MTRIPGSHAPNIKNRSSKHLIILTKHKPAVKSMSNEELMKYTSKEAADERRRRGIGTKPGADGKLKS